MRNEAREGFWREASSLEGAVSPKILGRVLAFGAIAYASCVLSWLVEAYFRRKLTLDLTPHELAGTALGLLLVMRTNAGYDRWWEARKLWGGFVDRARNASIGAFCYGPDDPGWRDRFARWLAAYPHVARHSLRRERPGPEVARLLGPEDASRVESAGHMPSLVALRLAELLVEARDRLGMDGFAFLQVDRERALLIDNYGGCERILNTPLPKVYSLKVRQFLALYLLTLPFALLHRSEADWIVPIITMIVAYLLLSLDQIGVELENPFAEGNLGHLPLDGLSAHIERGVFEVAKGRGAGG